MARTTSTAVAGIIEVDASIALDPFIETASQLVTDVCSESGYSAGKLELIERWLAAHFYCCRDPRPTSESAGVSESKQSAVTYDLRTSHYGQSAMVIDTSGNLAKLNKSISEGGKHKVVITTLMTQKERDYYATGF